MIGIVLKKFPGECLAGIAYGVGIDNGHEFREFGITGSGRNGQSHRILKGAVSKILARPVEPVGIGGQFWKFFFKFFIFGIAGVLHTKVHEIRPHESFVYNITNTPINNKRLKTKATILNFLSDFIELV